MNYKWLGLGLVFILGCGQDHIVLRATGDYFPLRIGNYWKYEDAVTKIPRIVEVKADSVVFGRSCTVVEDNFKESYWIKSEGWVEKFIVNTITRYGDEDTLEQAYRVFYLLPFVVGNTWSDTFADTVVVLTDTIVFHHAIEVTVAGIEDVNDFTDTYKVETVETQSQNDSTETRATTEWLAPGIGIVKRVGEGVDELLIEYQVK